MPNLFCALAPLLHGGHAGGELQIQDKIAFIILFHAATMPRKKKNNKGTVAACSLSFLSALHRVITITSASQTS